MYEVDNERVLKYANYILENNSTIRKCADHFSVAKSCVHYDLKYRLPKISLTKFVLVKEILTKNFEEKHIRGGQATKQLYLNKKSL